MFASGWHLHQSLPPQIGCERCSCRDEGEPLSRFGMHYLAGLHRACARRGGARDAHHQRLPALSRPSRSRPTARSGHATIAARCCACSASRAIRGASRTAWASRGQSVSLHRVAALLGPGRHRPQARPRPFGRRALRNAGRTTAALVGRGAGGAQRQRLLPRRLRRRLRRLSSAHQDGRDRALRCRNQRTIRQRRGGHGVGAQGIFRSCLIAGAAIGRGGAGPFFRAFPHLPARGVFMPRKQARERPETCAILNRICGGETAKNIDLSNTYMVNGTEIPRYT